MGLFEAVIRALLYLCGIVIVFYIILWVLGVLGIHIPAQIVSILMVMLGLVAILILVRLFYPFVAGSNWFGPRNPR